VGPKKSNLVVVLGLPGSGKTSLFLQVSTPAASGRCTEHSPAEAAAHLSHHPTNGSSHRVSRLISFTIPSLKCCHALSYSQLRDGSVHGGTVTSMESERRRLPPPL